MYPYKYLDSFETFFFEDELLDRCEIFSSLKGECISGNYYSHAINIWNTFIITQWVIIDTMVLFLVDVFEKFINTCLEYYGLDPCHYFSSPGLNWDAMLKITGIN